MKKVCSNPGIKVASRFEAGTFALPALPEKIAQGNL
jgi:hypothetical protein